MSEAKATLIKASFDDWGSDLRRAIELVNSGRHLLEGVLVLSCYIGALASWRFPGGYESEIYPKIVLQYSGKRGFFDQIDLLFLYQWPRSKFANRGPYKGFNNHSRIIEALKEKYGSDDDVKAKTRYVTQHELEALVSGAKIPDFDEQNFSQRLPLFSRAQILYRYVRCGAVHGSEFPLMNASRDLGGDVTYKPNHAITPTVLIDTAEAVLKNLREESLAKCAWPDEL